MVIINEYKTVQNRLRGSLTTFFYCQTLNAQHKNPLTSLEARGTRLFRMKIKFTRKSKYTPKTHHVMPPRCTRDSDVAPCA